MPLQIRHLWFADLVSMAFLVTKFCNGANLEKYRIFIMNNTNNIPVYIFIHFAVVSSP